MNKNKQRHLEKYMAHNEANFGVRKYKESVDMVLIHDMAAIGCTQEEMSALLRVSVAWIQKEMDENPAFAIAIESGQASMKQSLRRAQYKLALSGNATMLIWLGKQHLNQHDKMEQNNKTEINITVQRAMDELRSIPREKLLEAQAFLLADDVINVAPADNASASADNAASSATTGIEAKPQS